MSDERNLKTAWVHHYGSTHGYDKAIERARQATLVEAAEWRDRQGSGSLMYPVVPEFRGEFGSKGFDEHWDYWNNLHRSMVFLLDQLRVQAQAPQIVPETGPDGAHIEGCSDTQEGAAS